MLYYSTLVGTTVVATSSMIPQNLDLDIVGIGLFTNNGKVPVWNPASAEVVEACSEAANICKSYDVSLSKLALRCVIIVITITHVTHVPAYDLYSFSLFLLLLIYMFYDYFMIVI